MAPALSPKDAETVSWLAIKPDELLQAAQAHKHVPCALQQDQVSINHDGSVQLCCATFEQSNIVARNFLSLTSQDLAGVRAKHPTCDSCIAGGYHAAMMYKGVDQAERVAIERIGEREPEFTGIAPYS